MVDVGVEVLFRGAAFFEKTREELGVAARQRFLRFDRGRRPHHNSALGAVGESLVHRNGGTHTDINHVAATEPLWALNSNLKTPSIEEILKLPIENQSKVEGSENGDKKSISENFQEFPFLIKHH